jgi:hypothetical protein
MKGEKSKTNSVEHSVLPNTGSKLDGKTCYSRKHQFQSLSRERERKDISQGTPNNKRKVTTSSKNSSLVMLWLLNTMTNEIGDYLMYCNADQEMWDTEGNPLKCGQYLCNFFE